MNAKLLQSYFLAGLIAICSVLVFLILRPFLVTLVLAAIFATVLHPLYRGILRGMKGSPGLAAFATILISLICILGPLIFMTFQIASDAQQVYVSLSESNGSAFDSSFRYVQDMASRYTPGLQISAADLSASVSEYAKNGLQWIIQNLGGAFGGAARFVIDLFIFLIALYYLLRDGAALRQLITKASPLSEGDDDSVFAQLKLAINAIIRGSLIIALLQGILTGIGFAIFGIPNSLLWGVVASFSALIPGIGTSLVLIPGVAYLFLTGATTAGFGLLVWSFLAVGLIDNFLGPRLMGRGMQIHPLLVFLSVFGGLVFFGPAGVFLGPLCMSTLFAVLTIYRRSA